MQGLAAESAAAAGKRRKMSPHPTLELAPPHCSRKPSLQLFYHCAPALQAQEERKARPPLPRAVSAQLPASSAPDAVVHVTVAGGGASSKEQQAKAGTAAVDASANASPAASAAALKRTRSAPGVGEESKRQRTTSPESEMLSPNGTKYR